MSNASNDHAIRHCDDSQKLKQRTKRKKLRGQRERERKCGRSFPINADKEIRRGRKRIGAYLYSRKVGVSRGSTFRAAHFVRELTC